MSKPLKFVQMSDVVYVFNKRYRITAPVHPNKPTTTIEGYVVDVLINDLGKSEETVAKMPDFRFNAILTHHELREGLARRGVVIEDLGEWAIDDILNEQN